MKSSLSRPSWIIGILTASFFQLSLFAHPSYATLGQSADSIESDRVAATGKAKQAEAHGAYTVHEIQGTGFDLKEYLSNGGAVFGMSWSGKLPLALSKVFGSYLADYQTAADKAAQANVGRKRVRVPHILIQGSQVTLERFGHGAAAHSRAIVRQLIPAGVSANEIK